MYNHLNTVAPSRAQEFQNKHGSSMENTPKCPYDPIMKMIIDSLSKENTMQNRNTDQDYEKQLKPKNTKPKGMNTFTSEEVKRIERAVSMKEKAMEVAKEMGRKYMAVYHKMKSLERSAGMKSGKFSAEEVQRIRVAVMNKENHIAVAKELARPPESVRLKMYSIANDPGHGTRTNKSFSLQEDLLILDEVILHEDVTKLSCETTFSPSMAIREETGRNRSTLCARWDSHILPYLLQHYSGTTGFRIERILTRLVADKFTDQMGIDWSELVYQHKEFVGHTSASLSRTLQKIICDAKRYGRVSSLQEVADYAAEAYHPGKERKESSAKAARREAIVSYFKSKVTDLGINVELYSKVRCQKKTILFGNFSQHGGGSSQIPKLL